MNWSHLDNELDAWHAEGRLVSLWWRDDDATAPTPALDRLAGLARAHGVTVGIAVIPAIVQPVLATWLESVPADVLQHGWAHRNHAAAGKKKAEFGKGRDEHAVVRELKQGFDTLRGLAGPTVPAGTCPPVEPARPRPDPGPCARRLPRPLDVRSPFGGGAGAGAWADQLPCGLRGLAGRTGVRRARPGSRGSGRTSCGPTDAVGGSDRTDRSADAPCRARGGDLDLHRRTPGADTTPSSGTMACTQRGDTRMMEFPSGPSMHAGTAEERLAPSLHPAPRQGATSPTASCRGTLRPWCSCAATHRR